MSNPLPVPSDDLFETAVNFVLAHEGGYSNDQDDNGGETKFGISQRSYPTINVKSLTLEDAKAIYKRDFWETHLYKDIHDPELAIKLFDLSVNIGPKWAHKLIQRALRATGEDISEDGILGVVTLEAINRADPTDLLAALKSEAAGYYRTLVALDPKRAKYLKGWLKRAYTQPPENGDTHMKPGINTSEFWTTLMGSLIIGGAAHLGVPLDPASAASIAAMVMSYVGGRSFAKSTEIKATHPA